MITTQRYFSQLSQELCRMCSVDRSNFLKRMWLKTEPRTGAGFNAPYRALGSYWRSPDLAIVQEVVARRGRRTTPRLDY